MANSGDTLRADLHSSARFINRIAKLWAPACVEQLPPRRRGAPCCAASAAGAGPIACRRERGRPGRRRPWSRRRNSQPTAATAPPHTTWAIGTLTAARGCRRTCRSRPAGSTGARLWATSTASRASASATRTGSASGRTVAQHLFVGDAGRRAGVLHPRRGIRQGVVRAPQELAPGVRVVQPDEQVRPPVGERAGEGGGERVAGADPPEQRLGTGGGHAPAQRRQLQRQRLAVGVVHAVRGPPSALVRRAGARGHAARRAGCGARGGRAGASLGGPRVHVLLAAQLPQLCVVRWSPPPLLVLELAPRNRRLKRRTPPPPPPHRAMPPPSAYPAPEEKVRTGALSRRLSTVWPGLVELHRTSTELLDGI